MDKKFTLLVGEDAVVNFYSEKDDMFRHEGRWEELAAFESWRDIFRQAWSCDGLSTPPSAGMRKRKDDAVIKLVKSNIRMVDEEGKVWRVLVTKPFPGKQDRWGLGFSLSSPVEGRVSVRLGFPKE